MIATNNGAEEQGPKNKRQRITSVSGIDGISHENWVLFAHMHVQLIQDLFSTHRFAHISAGSVRVLGRKHRCRYPTSAGAYVVIVGMYMYLLEKMLLRCGAHVLWALRLVCVLYRSLLALLPLFPSPSPSLSFSPSLCLPLSLSLSLSPSLSLSLSLFLSKC